MTTSDIYRSHPLIKKLESAKRTFAKAVHLYEKAYWAVHREREEAIQERDRLAAENKELRERIQHLEDELTAFLGPEWEPEEL